MVGLGMGLMSSVLKHSVVLKPPVGRPWSKMGWSAAGEEKTEEEEEEEGGGLIMSAQFMYKINWIILLSENIVIWYCIHILYILYKGLHNSYLIFYSLLWSNQQGQQWNWSALLWKRNMQTSLKGSTKKHNDNSRTCILFGHHKNIRTSSDLNNCLLKFYVLYWDLSKMKCCLQQMRSTVVVYIFFFLSSAESRWCSVTFNITDV
jgi:hypothetical protein